MDHFNNLDTGYQLAAWFFVGSAAISFGIACAKLRNPSTEAVVARGDCPACKARKSLRVTPLNRSSAILTCGECVAQWLIDNQDGEQIVFGPASQPVMPTLKMTHHPILGNFLFETDVGLAVFNLESMEFSARRAFLSCSTPRHKLNFLYRSGIAPDRLDLTPKQAELAQQNDVTPYNWFAASAGLDIYWLMPGWTKDLHGTTENHDDD